MSVYTAKEIMEIIPHRHPFMLIDTIEELRGGARGRLAGSAEFLQEPFWQGTFRAIQ